MERRQIENAILWVYGENGILCADQMELFMIVESLPKRYFDVVIGRIVQEKKWSQMEAEYFYSERRMRDILKEAMEILQRRFSDAISKGKISPETAGRFFN